MNNSTTKILSPLTYESLFKYVEKGNLTIPISYLNNDKNIDGLINDIIKDFESTEAIKYSSYLNAITQNCEADELLKFGQTEINITKLTNNSPVNGILFHRDNLLYFISQIIQKTKKGTVNITGPGNLHNSQDYYKSLLLISSKLNKDKAGVDKEHTVLKDYFVRAHPYYYSPKISHTIYSRRIQRYWYIYSEILNDLDYKNKDKISEGLKLIEQKTKISLKDYFYVIGLILMWFFQLPLIKKNAKIGELQNSKGFNYQNIDSLYINKNNFAGLEAFINLVDHLSIDLEGMKQKFSDEMRRDKVEGFYKYFQNFFDNPIFKIDEQSFCIIDLKFLFEGICSGFLWHIRNILSDKFEFKEIKEQYGYLLEEYFIFLMKKIFNNIEVTSKNTGKPDVVLRFDDYIIIFEFTTEYYRFASLYNTETSLFFDDLYKILFNVDLRDKRARGKKDEGKFLKLEKYIKEEQESGKKIIPVLVTENYIGDYELINRFDKFIENEISNKNLENLKKYKPFIINLDDLETFWAFSESRKSGQQFVEHIKSWERVQKGTYHYNFSFFMIENNGVIINSKYKEFYNFSNFLEKLDN